MIRKIIKTDKAPAAIGPYSQAVVSNNLVFTAGQIPINPVTGKLVDGNFKDRVVQVFENISAILAEAGTNLKYSVKMTVFLIDLGRFAEVNEVFAKYFEGIEPPSRSAVQVSALPLGVDVEIECIATL